MIIDKYLMVCWFKVTQRPETWNSRYNLKIWKRSTRISQSNSVNFNSQRKKSRIWIIGSIHTNHSNASVAEWMSWQQTWTFLYGHFCCLREWTKTRNIFRQKKNSERVLCRWILNGNINVKIKHVVEVWRVTCLVSKVFYFIFFFSSFICSSLTLIATNCLPVCRFFNVSIRFRARAKKRNSADIWIGTVKNLHTSYMMCKNLDQVVVTVNMLKKLVKTFMLKMNNANGFTICKEQKKKSFHSSWCRLQTLVFGKKTLLFFFLTMDGIVVFSSIRVSWFLLNFKIAK